MTHPERAASQRLLVDFQQERLHWLFHLQLRYPVQRKVPPATRQLKSSLGLDGSSPFEQQDAGQPCVSES
jgi:hypothetical protein